MTDVACELTSPVAPVVRSDEETRSRSAVLGVSAPLRKASQPLAVPDWLPALVAAAPSCSALSSPVCLAALQQLFEEYSPELLPVCKPVDLIRHKLATEQVQEMPFFVFDFGVLLRQYCRWVTLLPRVVPFYAVKCNPDTAIIRFLATLGAGFDCASQPEIEQVLAHGVEPSRIIMANPCKPLSHIVGARALGVHRMTFDNADELIKIRKAFPAAELVLRILPDDSHSVMKFGSKFGAPPSTWHSLFKAARDLMLNVVGISFHVGSGCMSPLGFTETIKVAHAAWVMGESFGFELTLLDIGGGFPGNEEAGISFASIATVVAPLLDELFAPHVQIIGEPGRYFASDVMALATSVYARRFIEPLASEVPGASADLRWLYYVNDGVYGSFNNIFFDHAEPKPVLVKPAGDLPKSKCNMFGPTCDSMDCILRSYELPELSVGDWLCWPSMGAYTRAAASAFNGFQTKTIFYVCTL